MGVKEYKITVAGNLCNGIGKIEKRGARRYSLFELLHKNVNVKISLRIKESNLNKTKPRC